MFLSGEGSGVFKGTAARGYSDLGPRTRLGDLEGHEGSRRRPDDDPQDGALITRIIDKVLADHPADT